MARGEQGVPVEQVMRDMRINRIFEGSTEIMHLLIAREAVDTHLAVAGDILEPDVEFKDKAKAAKEAAAFYPKWLAGLAAGKGQSPSSYSDFGDLAKHLRFAERSSRKLARSTFYGMTRWQAKLEKKQGYLGRLVDIGAELFAIASAVVYANTIKQEQPERGEQAEELADLFCRQSRRRVDALFNALWANDDADELRVGPEAPRRPLRVAGGGHRRSLGRRPDDRRTARRGRGAGAQEVSGNGASANGAAEPAAEEATA